MRSTGESFSNPDAAKRRFPEAEITSFALSALPPHGAFARGYLAVHAQTGIDSVELTLVGLLRHSKRFFGLSGPVRELVPIPLNAVLRRLLA